VTNKTKKFSFNRGVTSIKRRTKEHLFEISKRIDARYQRLIDRLIQDYNPNLESKEKLELENIFHQCSPRPYRVSGGHRDHIEFYAKREYLSSRAGTPPFSNHNFPDGDVFPEGVLNPKKFHGSSSFMEENPLDEKLEAATNNLMASALATQDLELRRKILEENKHTLFEIKFVHGLKAGFQDEELRRNFFKIPIFISAEEVDLAGEKYFLKICRDLVIERVRKFKCHLRFVENYFSGIESEVMKFEAVSDNIARKKEFISKHHLHYKKFAKNMKLTVDLTSLSILFKNEREAKVFIKKLASELDNINDDWVEDIKNSSFSFRIRRFLGEDQVRFNIEGDLL
jgi:hypothetical protein